MHEDILLKLSHVGYIAHIDANHTITCIMLQQAFAIVFYITLISFSTKYLEMCKVYTDEGDKNNYTMACPSVQY